MTQLKAVPLDSQNSRQHRTVISTATNDLLRVRPPHDKTEDEAAAGVTPNTSGASRPWTDAVLRYGLIGDGTTDNTLAFTAMFSVAGQALFIKRGDYVTGKFSIPSNTTLYLEPGTIIRDSGVLGVNDRFINISSEVAGGPLSKIHIIGWGARVLMDRADYGSGEQRHGLHIAGDVSDICVEGLDCSDCGGDGFCVGGLGGGLEDTPADIILNAVQADNNRRNALSVTACRRMIVANSQFTNSNGTSPQKGIDVEPDSDGAGAMVGELEHLVITGCRTSGNVSAGFSFVQPYTSVGKRITVSFIDCESNGDAGNFQMDNTRAGTNGVVRFQGCTGYNATNNGFEAKSSGMYCEVTGMRIFDANQGANSGAHQGASYAVFSVSGTDGSTYGNLIIRDSYARGTSQVKTFTQLISGEATSIMANVDAEIDTDAVATKRASYGLTSSQISGKNRVVFIDETELATTSSLNSSTMPGYLNDLITNSGASGALALNLSDALTRLRGVRVRARVKTAQRMEIDPGSGWTIGGGAQLFSNNVGSEVTIESDGTAKWRIVAGGEGWGRDQIALDNTGTPSVAAGTMFETGGTTTITALNGGFEGQEITILVKHAVTFDCTGTTLKGNAGADFVAASGDLVRGIFDGTNWRLSFHDCT